MKAIAISIPAVLLAALVPTANAGAFSEALSFRPEAPRFEAAPTRGGTPDHLQRANPFEVRPDYPAGSRSSGVETTSATPDRYDGRPGAYPANPGEFPAHRI